MLPALHLGFMARLVLGATVIFLRHVSMYPFEEMTCVSELDTRETEVVACSNSDDFHGIQVKMNAATVSANHVLSNRTVAAHMLASPTDSQLGVAHHSTDQNRDYGPMPEISIETRMEGRESLREDGRCKAHSTSP